MKCEDLDWVELGRRPLTAEEQAHVAGCELCGLLAKGGASDAPPSDALGSQILGAAHAELAKAPRAGSWLQPWMIGSAIAAVCAAAGLVMMRTRVDWPMLPMLDVAVNLGLLAGAFVLAGRAAFGPGLVPRGRGPAAVLAVLASASLLALPGSHGGLEGGTPICFAAILGISAVPLLGFYALLRARSRSWLTGVCAGLAAGALSEAVLFVHCPYSGFGHLFFAHLGAWAALAALGALAVTLFPARLWPRAQRP